jgi:hypothetical protein
MLIWSGYGIVVAIITFVNLLLAQLISNRLANDDRFYQRNLFPMGIALLLSALLIRLLWRYMALRKQRELRISFADRLMRPERKHHLFFIPVKYWHYITATLGAGVMLWQLVR